MIGEKFIGVFDRGYDDNKIFKYMSNNKHEFVVRLDDERILLFKGKKRSVGEVAKTRKGKISYKALFDDSEEYELMLSYTKATLPANKEEYTLVIVYGLSEKSPMKLLTNINIKDKADVIKNKREYSYDDIEAKLSVICVRNKVNFTNDNEEKQDQVITYSLNDDTDSVPAWLKAVQRTQSKQD